jgi:hypothetical protein
MTSPPIVPEPGDRGDPDDRAPPPYPEQPTMQQRQAIKIGRAASRADRWVMGCFLTFAGLLALGLVAVCAWIVLR